MPRRVTEGIRTIPLVDVMIPLDESRKESDARNAAGGGLGANISRVGKALTATLERMKEEEKRRIKEAIAATRKADQIRAQKAEAQRALDMIRASSDQAMEQETALRLNPPGNNGMVSSLEREGRKRLTEERGKQKHLDPLKQRRNDLLRELASVDKELAQIGSQNGSSKEFRDLLAECDRLQALYPNA